MMPLTENLPKPLIEVNGKPFLYHLIERIKKAGFDELAIVIGHKMEKVIEWCEKEGIKAQILEKI